MQRKKKETDLAQEETTAREAEEELILGESGSRTKEVEKTMEERTIPIQRKKRRKITVSPDDFAEDSDSETIAQAIEKRRKVTASSTGLVEDPIHEAAAKAVEQEHSKAIVVFERAERRRQQQFLREETAAPDAFPREMAREQQTAEHYSLRSSLISVSASGTSNFLHAFILFLSNL